MAKRPILVLTGLVAGGCADGLRSPCRQRDASPAPTSRPVGVEKLKINADVHGNERTCRICFQPESAPEPVVAPCRCTGGSEWVHESCLRRWRSAGGKHNALARTHCPTCSYPYSDKYAHLGGGERCLTWRDFWVLFVVYVVALRSAKWSLGWHSDLAVHGLLTALLITSTVGTMYAHDVV